MAYPGDIVGLYDPGKLRIGDTLSAKILSSSTVYLDLHRNIFARILLKDPMKRKHLDAGLQQLSHEGVINYFIEKTWEKQTPI